jgi:hypothetical protein
VQHAFERVAAHGGIAAIVHVLEFDVLFAGTEQDHFVYCGLRLAHGASTSNL